MKLNEKTFRLLEGLGSGHLKIEEFESGTVYLVDLGLESEVDLDTALDVAEATTGTLGKVSADEQIHVSIPESPAVATLGCQLAGWRVKMGDSTGIGSGPARILADKPAGLLSRINYFESSDKAALLLESDVLPSSETCKSLLEQTAASEMIIGVFSGNSLTGLINVLARVVEVGIFRLYNLGFDVTEITKAEGSAPMVEKSGECMFEANDAIIYHGLVELEVNSWMPGLEDKAVSRNSPAHGRSFCDIFEQADRSFYNIPEDIFAPARLKVKDGAGLLFDSGPI